MAYSELAKALRRCRATTKAGRPCRAYACWDDPRGLCAAHGRHHRGPLPKQYAPHKRANYEPCSCRAYAWPHRPGGGLCRWPQEPEYRMLTRAGTHGEFNGNPYRMFSLGMRLNRQREERAAERWWRDQREQTRSETTATPQQIQPPEVDYEEERRLIFERFGRGEDWSGSRTGGD